ncbi:MAG: hypothetical protein RLZZ299_1698 [Pseudomonadota bacterium]
MSGALGLLLPLVACTAPAQTDDSAQAAPPVDTAAEALAADDAAIRALDPASLPAGAAPCAPVELVRVVRAVDGDTIYVAPDGGRTTRKVRLIGVDTPEIAHDDPAECWGDEAWAYTEQALEGRLAWLTYDAECVDRYDRVLAYVHRGTGEDGFYNRRLIREGQATALAVRPNTTFEAMLDADERAARGADRGLWGGCAR